MKITLKNLFTSASKAGVRTIQITPGNATIGNGGAGGTILLGTVTAGSIVLTNFTRKN